jgi:hypothetical protein
LKVGEKSKNKNKLEEKAMRRILFLLGIVILFVSSTGLGQQNFYRTKSGGDWNNQSIWEVSSDSSNWSDASTYPKYKDSSIVVQTGHSVTFNLKDTIDRCFVMGTLVIETSDSLWLKNGAGDDLIINGTVLNKGRFRLIESGATWRVKSGGTYIHNTTTAISAPLDNATLEDGSNFVYRGSSSLKPAVSISGRTYYKLRYESESGTWTHTATSGIYPLTINGNFEIGAGVTVDYQAGFTGGVNLKGNVAIDGTFKSAGKVNFNGTVSQSISGSGQFFVDSLIINNSNGVSVGLSIVDTNLIFTSGKLTTVGGGSIKVLGSISGAGPGKFVDGNLVLPVSLTGSKKWETGQGNDYLPLTINFASLTGSGDVTVTVLDRTSTPPGGPIGANKVLKRYFRVTQSGGITSFNAYLTLTYTDDDVSEQGITNENSLRVFQWDGAQWKELTVIDRDVNNNTITVTGVTSFSDFVISGTGDAPLPVQVASVLADVSGRDVRIKIKTQTEPDDFLGFNVYRSRDGKNFVMVGSYESVSSLRAKGNMAYGGEYEFVDKGLNSGSYQYKIEAVGKNEKKFVGDVISVEVDVPKVYALHQNYPNPFNPVTVIEFETPEAGYVLIELYNSVGWKVRDIFAGELPAGYHKVRFDASGLSSGVYFYRMSAGKFNAVRKMVIMK